MNKKIIISLALSILTVQPLQTQSYVNETIAAVATATGVVVLGVLGWNALSYSQQQADRDSIAAVAVIDPTKELNDITALFEQARISKKSVGEVLAHYCATHATNAQDLCARLTAYSKKADEAFAKLSTNYAVWQKNNNALASVAAQTLNNPQILATLQSLRGMCADLSKEQDYAQAYCAYHTIATKTYCNYGKQFYLVHAANDIAHDIEKLKNLIRKLDAAPSRDNEQYNRYTSLKSKAQVKITELAREYNETIHTREYLEQKSAQFIFEEQQKMLAVEQERVKIEKLKAEKELREAQFNFAAHTRELEILQKNNYNLSLSNKRLTEEKEVVIEKLNRKEESFHALRFELENLKRQCAALEQLKAQLLNDLNNALEKNKFLVEQYNKIEQALTSLKDKITKLQSKINNPPFNPENQAMMIAFLKQSIVELIV